MVSIRKLLNPTDLVVKIYDKTKDFPRLAQLETLSIAYIARAFEQMGWEFQFSQGFTTAFTAQQLSMASQQNRLLARLLEMLAEEGVLRRIDGLWAVVLAPEIQDPQKQVSILLAQDPSAEAELGRPCVKKVLPICEPSSKGVRQASCPTSSFTSSIKVIESIIPTIPISTGSLFSSATNIASPPVIIYTKSP